MKLPTAIAAVLALLLVGASAQEVTAPRVTSLSKARAVINELVSTIKETQGELESTQLSLLTATSQNDAAGILIVDLNRQIVELGVERDTAWASSDKYQKAFQVEQAARIQTGRERDIFLLAFAIAAAVAATSFARPVLMWITPPWGMAAYGACIVATFAGAFYLGRLAVSMIIHAIFRV